MSTLYLEIQHESASHSPQLSHHEKNMVRDDSSRTQLFDLDMAINQVSQALSQLHPAVVALTNCYHNLLRRYAEV